MENKIVLKLYIAGHTAKSENAVINIKNLCEERFRGMYSLRIVDVLEDPKIAEDVRILATPTLVREQPAPERRLIGDLSDTEMVLKGLGINLEKKTGGKRGERK
ncbi:MAG TPA: circadian clock protein KaiB [Spirochaetes bacterium]|nr:circadian clock protein KaiB [Spirochaetota bacterium]